MILSLLIILCLSIIVTGLPQEQQTDNFQSIQVAAKLARKIVSESGKFALGEEGMNQRD